MEGRWPVGLSFPAAWTGSCAAHCVFCASCQWASFLMVVPRFATNAFWLPGLFFQMVIINMTTMNILVHACDYIVLHDRTCHPPPTPSVGTGQSVQPLSVVSAARPRCRQGYNPSSAALSSMTSLSVSHVPPELDSLCAPGRPFPCGPACSPAPQPVFLRSQQDWE